MDNSMYDFTEHLNCLAYTIREAYEIFRAACPEANCYFHDANGTRYQVLYLRPHF